MTQTPRNLVIAGLVFVSMVFAGSLYADEPTAPVTSEQNQAPTQPVGGAAAAAAPVAGAITGTIPSGSIAPDDTPIVPAEASPEEPIHVNDDTDGDGVPDGVIVDPNSDFEHGFTDVLYDTDGDGNPDVFEDDDGDGIPNYKDEDWVDENLEDLPDVPDDENIA